MSTADALSAMGNDLAFSVSFAIANELLNAAKEAHLTEEELISMVLGLSVLLAALPASITGVRSELKARFSQRSGEKKESADVDTKASGLLDFLLLLLEMAQRISVSICVQLLASNARTRQPLRSVRVVTLLAVAIFFLFLESTSSVGAVRSRRQ